MGKDVPTKPVKYLGRKPTVAIKPLEPKKYHVHTGKLRVQIRATLEEQKEYGKPLDKDWILARITANLLENYGRSTPLLKEGDEWLIIHTYRSAYDSSVSFTLCTKENYTFEYPLKWGLYEAYMATYNAQLLKHERSAKSYPARLAKWQKLKEEWESWNAYRETEEFKKARKQGELARLHDSFPGLTAILDEAVVRTND